MESLRVSDWLHGSQAGCPLIYVVCPTSESMIQPQTLAFNDPQKKRLTWCCSLKSQDVNMVMLCIYI